MNTAFATHEFHGNVIFHREMLKMTERPDVISFNRQAAGSGLFRGAHPCRRRARSPAVRAKAFQYGVSEGIVPLPQRTDCGGNVSPPCHVRRRYPDHHGVAAGA